MLKIYDLSVTLRPAGMESCDITLTRIPHDEAARIFAERHALRVSTTSKVTALPTFPFTAPDD